MLYVKLLDILHRYYSISSWEIYKKKAAAAPRPARAGTMVIMGAAPVASSGDPEVWDAPELAASVPEEVGESVSEAGSESSLSEAVTVALLADAVAAAEASGSESPPAVMTISAMLKYPAGSVVVVDVSRAPPVHSSEMASGPSHTELRASSRPLVVIVQVASSASVFLRVHSPARLTVIPSSATSALNA